MFSQRLKPTFRLFLVLSYLYCSADLFAQQADDAIPIYGFNEKFLEHLIKEKIDSVRQAHELPSLYNDSILFVAAKFHANYLYNRKELSHTEPENKIMETPQKRADYFGAVNYLVGENIAFTVIGKPIKDKKGKFHTNTTYNQTASDLAIMWVNSPGHYKNIITPDYNATGVAIWADAKTGRVYAVQKFANILFKYDFKENKYFFNYSGYTPPQVVSSFEGIDRNQHKGKHAHHLKRPKRAAQCNNCYDSLDFQFGLSQIYPKNGKIIFSSYEYNQILNLLKKRKDGFAVEIITYNPYDCGNPAYYSEASRRNGQCVFSGKVLIPVYRKKALKGFRAGSKRKKIAKKIEKGKIKKYELTLGKIPKNIPDYMEFNLVIIQKKRVCRVIRFSGYCGDTLERFYPLPLYIDTVSEGMDLKEDYKNVRFSIPFQKGKTEYSMADIRPITDSLLSTHFIADSIVINAYSSVEGKEALNKKIQAQRAQNIAGALAKNQKEKLNTVIYAEENWVLFEKQIREKEMLKEYRGLLPEKIKELLEDSMRQKKIESFLQEQRVAHIRLRAREVLTPKNMEPYLKRKVTGQKNRIDSLLSDSAKKEELRQSIDTLTLLMGVAYNYIRDKHIAPSFFDIFRTKDNNVFNAYHQKRLKYLAKIDTSAHDSLAWNRRFYEELVELYNQKHSSFFVNYNMLQLIQKYGKDMNVSIADEQKNNYLSELKLLCTDSLQRSLCEKLELNFWFSICRQTFQETSKNKQALHISSLENIHSYFQNKVLSNAEKNKICNYYLYHARADWALELLWPDYEKKTDNLEGLEILAKILYINYEEYKETAYYDFLKELYARMGAAKWCPMFIGPCNISFQVLDYEAFRDFYCDKCHDYLNYAKAPQNFENKSK